MTRPANEPPDPVVDGTALVVLVAIAIVSFVVAAVLIYTGPGDAPPLGPLVEAVP